MPGNQCSPFQDHNLELMRSPNYSCFPPDFATISRIMFSEDLGKYHTEISTLVEVSMAHLLYPPKWRILESQRSRENTEQTIFMTSCVYLGTHWHVAKATKYGKFSFDCVQAKFSNLIAFSEGKNSLFAYYPS